jgi:hypothetical protein
MFTSKINNQVLFGKDHIQVIEILKRMKNDIKLICARRRTGPNNGNSSVHGSFRSRSISFGKTTEIAVKAKSMGKLNAMETYLPRISKARSLEVISNLALWSTSTITIELTKGDHGLGFSVLDYQDPSNPSYSPVIVIRALVPGGVAQLDGRVVPGDRLVAVNDITLENMKLDDVIKVLRSTPQGAVKLRLSKPLPYPKFKSDNDDRPVTDSDQDVNNNSRRLSRLSKSKTTAEINEQHQVDKYSSRLVSIGNSGWSTSMFISACCRYDHIDRHSPLLTCRRRQANDTQSDRTMRKICLSSYCHRDGTRPISLEQP